MLFRVGIRHVQSPTPYAGASNVRYICQDASLAEYLCHKMPRFSIQSSLESPKDMRMRPRGPPDPRLVPEGV